MRMTTPRLLAIMGSGEIAPTMAKVHRALFARLADPAATGTILDTPYGFQENADDLSERTVDFFRESVGREFSVASFRSRGVDAVTEATAVARIRDAAYVMAGPGSPSYALRQWMGGPIPGAIAAHLRDGGIVTMASAAALTLGLVTIPVYEIYKVGETPRWLEGLDLLGSATGLRAAVVPHFDNAEGGNHDTRFCYMGERRLRALEDQLPAGAFILGVDGHTALTFDLVAGRASVAGLGGVTIRAGGRSTTLAAGSEVAIDAIAEAASSLAAGAPITRAFPASPVQLPDARPTAAPRGAAVDAPLFDRVSYLEGAMIASLAGGDVRDAVAALLELDEVIAARARAGEESPDLDSARSTFRALIARLGEAAGRTPEAASRAILAPLVEPLLELRERARANRDWATADEVRERLEAAGVEIRDDPEGSTWRLREVSAR